MRSFLSLRFLSPFLSFSLLCLDLFLSHFVTTMGLFFSFSLFAHNNLLSLVPTSTCLASVRRVLGRSTRRRSSSSSTGFSSFCFHPDTVIIFGRQSLLYYLSLLRSLSFNLPFNPSICSLTRIKDQYKKREEKSSFISYILLLL